MEKREWERELEFTDDELTDMGVEEPAPTGQARGAAPSAPAATSKRKKGAMRVPDDVVPRRDAGTPPPISTPVKPARTSANPPPATAVTVPETATDKLVNQALEGNGVAAASMSDAIPNPATAGLGGSSDEVEVTIEVAANEGGGLVVVLPTPPAVQARAASVPPPPPAASAAADAAQKKDRPTPPAVPVSVIAAVLVPQRPTLEEEELSGEELEEVPMDIMDTSELHEAVPPNVTPVRPSLPVAGPGGPPPPPVAAPTPPPRKSSTLKVRRRRVRAWFEEIFDEDYLRTLPFMTADQTRHEADFIEASLHPPKTGQLLDLGCGYGRHALELAARGYQIVGLDLSLPLLIRAADEAQRRSLNVNFVHGDMRELAFEAQFDAAYCMLTTFGYFDDQTNRKVVQALARALKPGGRLLIEVLNRDYVIADLPTRLWWEGDGCVVLEEVDFNFFTSRMDSRRSIVFEDGRQVEQEIAIRAYSLHELGRVLHHGGFRVTEVSGSLATRGRFFGAASRTLLVTAEKREPKPL